MSIYARSAEIIRRVRLEMPIQLTLPDPATGHSFEISRDNILSLLVIDSGNIFLEGQTVAALYVEMARCRRACERAAAHAEMDYRRWKAEQFSSFKESREKTTDKAAEAHYRTLPEYRANADLPDYYKTLGYLFADLMEGFMIKSRMIDAQSRMLGQQERIAVAEASSGDHETEESLERLEELAALVIAASGSAATVTRPPQQIEEDEEEEDAPDEENEEEEEEEEEEDDDLPPPPPPPSRNKKKQVTTKRSPRKRSTR